MTDIYGCDPAHILAAIGPGISKCCFETHADVPNAMTGAMGASALPYIAMCSGGTYKVDLKGLNSMLLQKAGLLAEHISADSDCTLCNPGKYWSYRAHGDDRGSMAAMIQMTVLAPGGRGFFAVQQDSVSAVYGGNFAKRGRFRMRKPAEILLSVFLLIGLVSCGGETAASPSPTPTPTPNRPWSSPCPEPPPPCTPSWAATASTWLWHPSSGKGSLSWTIPLPPKTSLCESYSVSADGLTWTFTLRSG
jgi:hypothetical protein